MKDYIDRKFMSMYSTGLDQMEAKMAASAKPTSKAKEQGVAAAAGPEALAAVSAAKMRCGGCGGKVSSHSCGCSSAAVGGCRLVFNKLMNMPAFAWLSMAVNT